MKTAVIGLGVMGGHHARVYKELGVLHGVYDMNPSVTNMVGDKYDCKKYYSLNSLLEDQDLRAVTIATPTPSHFDIGKECIEHGLHVLMEKPFTVKASEARELMNLAEAHQVILAAGYIERFNPAVRELIERLHKYEIGVVTSIHMKRVGGIPRSANNVVEDLMTHDFNILLGIFGYKPLKKYVCQLERDGIVDSAQVLLDFGQATATCEANWISPIKIRTIEVTGTEGYCSVDLIKQTITWTYGHTDITRRFSKEPLKEELIGFIKTIEGDPAGEIVSSSSAFETLRMTVGGS